MVLKRKEKILVFTKHTQNILTTLYLSSRGHSILLFGKNYRHEFTYLEKRKKIKLIQTSVILNKTHKSYEPSLNIALWFAQ